MALIKRKGQSAAKKPQKTAKKAEKSVKASPSKPSPRKPYVRHNPKPEFVPTKDQRTIVTMGVSSKMTERQLCSHIINPATGKAISVTTLRKAFKEELEEGEARMIAAVRSNLMQVALDKKHKGCVTAGIWILKTRAGDREPPPEWQLRKMEAEAKATATDGEGNETELTFTLKLEEERPPRDESEFDYSQPQRKGPGITA